jgi:hypothetical protein
MTRTPPAHDHSSQPEYDKYMFLPMLVVDHINKQRISFTKNRRLWIGHKFKLWYKSTKKPSGKEVKRPRRYIKPTTPMRAQSDIGLKKQEIIGQSIAT